jgi:AbrB family looped-hinge helix DNA binding protein
MRMKVHNKGQVVLPAEIRAQLGIEIGDILEVEVVAEEGKIELRRSETGTAASLGGSLERYARGKPFPSRSEMANALRRGMLGDG